MKRKSQIYKVKLNRLNRTKETEVLGENKENKENKVSKERSALQESKENVDLKERSVPALLILTSSQVLIQKYPALKKRLSLIRSCHLQILIITTLITTLIATTRKHKISLLNFLASMAGLLHQRRVSRLLTTPIPISICCH